MKRIQKITPWLMGILIATILMGSLALISGLQYTGNDDTPILRATMGYYGEPATFLLHTHVAFTWLLYGLAKLFPGAAWFSILQLFLLWFSQVVIIKSMMQSAKRRNIAPLLGAVIGGLFLLAFTLYISCRITYTVTASLCGAAAVFQLASADFSKGRGQIMAGVLGGAALLLCSYFLRLSSVVPSACFFVFLFIFKYFSVHAKSAMTALIIAAAVFAIAVGVNIIDNSLQDEDYLEWQSERITLFDYVGISEDVSDETLAEIGWSRDELTLVNSWFFLNDNITAQAFAALSAELSESDDTTIFGAIQSGWELVRSILSDTQFSYAILCMLLMGLAASLRGTRRTALYLAGVFAGGFALLMILGVMGRLPVRAVYSILLPGGAAVYAAFLDTTDPLRKPGELQKTALPILLCFAVTLLAIPAQTDAAYVAPSEYFTDTTSNLYADLDEIALMNEDMLIIYDLSLSHDHRLFPNIWDELPQNLLLWGGWMAQSEGFYDTLERFGITELTPELFLQDNVLYASTYDQPTTELMNYIGEGTDETVDWYYYDQWGYVVLFEFDTY